MRVSLILIGLGLLTAAAGTAQTVRVGTFGKKAAVVAFYRSTVWAETLKSKTAERDAARQASDTKRVEELDKWGSGQQELAHRQLAGEAPITNILEALAPALPEIARRAQVALIVSDVLYAGPAVEPVDVTEQLLVYLKADERTRAIVRELK